MKTTLSAIGAIGVCSFTIAAFAQEWNPSKDQLSDVYSGKAYSPYAARTFPAEAECYAWARSASEAFLYRRLQTLEATHGRFILNARLPIPFDQCGHIEVDLLCRDARLAVEIDGPQHLADPEAYRRDRRKDARLQEDGYFVLRFLAEDVGKRLDDVLDGILRALAHVRGGSERP